MSESAITSARFTRIVAANGVTYGSPRQAAAWGSARSPLVPRAFRAAYGALETPRRLANLVGESQLTVADLGVEIWDRLGLSELPPTLRREIRSWLSQLHAPHVPDAIPAGLPLSWVAALPLRTRTRNAVLRVVEDNGGDGPLASPLSSSDLLALPNVGTTTLVDMLCVIESAELHMRVEHAHVEAPPSQTDGRIVVAVESYIGDLASWALAETDSATLGGALAAASSSSGESEVWSALATLKLTDIAEPIDHPYTSLSNWAERLSDRELPIFRLRIAVPQEPQTLQQLADQLGVTRERIRQLENRILEQLALFVESPGGKSVRWRVDTLRRRLGVAAPIERAEALLAPPDEHNADYGPLLLKLAGPYDLSHGWLVRRDAVDTDPTETIRGITDEVGRIDRARVTEALDEWGLERSLHEEWIVRDRRVRSINGHLVRWDGPIADKLAFALADRGTPATAEVLLAQIEESRATTSAKNAMAEDDRFIRANRTEWALSSWGLPEYSGIASTIGQILEREEQPIRIDDVVERMRADFGIAEGSARAYCDAAMFVVEDGWIRLRRSHEPYRYRDAAVRDAAGVFALGEGRVGLLFEVDRDVLRGSGRQLPPAVGALLDLSIDDRLRFDGPGETSVAVTFPGTSFMGPSLGSTRALAETAGAELGSQLTVVLDLADMSVMARATNLSEHQADWSLVARLTGIREGTGMDGLAAALQCTRGEVRATLRTRGDHHVLAALPARRSTPDLEEALAELDAEMQKGELP